jgi:2-methylcitrate dehydratase PrpD
MDDVNNESSLHPGVVAYPTALAMADIVPMDGKTFITAVTSGYEVMVRLGRALKPAEHYGRGFHPTGTCGAFGAAAVAGLALGLEGHAFCRALGIAGSQAAGSMEFLGPGEPWTKRFHPGWASHSGIWAGLLARAGFLGPTTIIEGRSGFLQGYSGEPDPSQVLSNLGVEFQITRTSVKPHACCRYNQGPIDCLLDLKTRYGLDGQDVEGVKVGILSGGYNIVAAPAEEKRNPTSVTDMQFSMPFGAAVALLYGRASLAEYISEVAQRSEVKKLMAKVECVRDPALDAKYPRRWPAWAEVRTRGGLTLRNETEYPKGDPENALTWHEIKDKFLTLSAPVISYGRRRELIAAVEELQDMGDIRDLAALLTTDKAAHEPPA